MTGTGPRIMVVAGDEGYRAMMHDLLIEEETYVTLHGNVPSLTELIAQYQTNLVVLGVICRRGAGHHGSAHDQKTTVDQLCSGHPVFGQHYLMDKIADIIRPLCAAIIPKHFFIENTLAAIAHAVAMSRPNTYVKEGQS